MKTTPFARCLIPAVIVGLAWGNLHAAPETIPLWPDGAPGAKGTRPEDTPRVDVYVPTGKTCGAGVVVLPGGGYGGLAADHEGRQIAQFYNSLGVTAFV